MPELRKDPVTQRWVIIAPERARRPASFTPTSQRVPGPFCPFCAGNEARTPPELLAVRPRDSRPNGPGWSLRVVPNRAPVLGIEGSLEQRGVGLYDRMNGIGAHEVIIETPEHHTSLTALPRAQVEAVLGAARDRLADLKRDQRLAYGLIFKNVGAPAGAALEHTHCQLLAAPIVPPSVELKLRGAEDFHRYRGRCLWCDIVQQESEDRSRVVLEDRRVLVFAPYASRFPFETCIVPKEHGSCFEHAGRETLESLADALLRTLGKIEGALDRPSYNLHVHTAPYRLGECAHFHWHVEVIPRISRPAGFVGGTGLALNPVPPEEAALLLRRTAM